MDYTITIKKIDDNTYFGQCNEVPGAIVECSSVEEVLSEMQTAIPEVLAANKLLAKKRFARDKVVTRRVSLV